MSQFVKVGQTFLNLAHVVTATQNDDGSQVKVTVVYYQQSDFGDRSSAMQNFMRKVIPAPGELIFNGDEAKALWEAIEARWNTGK